MVKFLDSFLSLFKSKLTIWTMLVPFILPAIGTIAFLVIFTLFFRLFIRPYLLMQQLKNIPGAYTLYRPVFGVFGEFKKFEKTHGDLHYMSKKRIQEHPDMRFLASPFKSKLMILLYDPVLVKEFLTKEREFTCKDLRKFETFHESAKKGLPFTQGEHWEFQRKLVTEVFNFDYVKSLIPIIQKTAKEWIAHNMQEDSTVIDVSKKTKYFTAKIVTKLFFGDHGFPSREEFIEFIETGIRNHSTLMKISFSPWNFLFGPKFYRLGLRSVDRLYNKQVKYLDKSYYGMLEIFKKRIQDQKTNGDKSQKTLLELFLDQNSDNPEAQRMSDADIVGQMSTFFTAGTNSTAEFLVSALYFLALHKDVQQKLRAEINANYEKSETLDFPTISGMEYLDSFVKETFRMQTPTSLLYQREVKENTDLLDLKLKKGYRINVDVIGMGYNPKLFQNPVVFKPERWLERKDPGVTEPFAHIPFAEGPHKCPGQSLALIESKILLCELVKKFDLEISRPYHLRLGFGFVYHAMDPLKIEFTKL